jgi:hypothetical protein
MGGLVTHLSAEHSVKLIRKLLRWTQPNGILAISIHGRFAQSWQDSGEFTYIDAEAWENIKAQLAREVGSDRDNYSLAETSATPITSALRHFAHVSYLMQRPVIGSVMMPSASGLSTAPPLCFEKNGEEHFEEVASARRRG